MSGNRANAAAINRRTSSQQPAPLPNNINRGPPQQQRTNNISSQGLRNNNQRINPIRKPQLSISDAIALITLRLGTVETFINALPPLDQINGAVSNDSETNENIRVVDEAVFKSIVSRLEKVEKAKPTNQNDELLSLKNEVSQVKNLLLSVQSFTIQTNQKILEIENNYKSLLKNEEPTVVDEEFNQVENIDMKQIIQDELEE